MSTRQGRIFPRRRLDFSVTHYAGRGSPRFKARPRYRPASFDASRAILRGVFFLVSFQALARSQVFCCGQEVCQLRPFCNTKLLGFHFSRGILVQVDLGKYTARLLSSLSDAGEPPGERGACARVFACARADASREASLFLSIDSHIYIFIQWSPPACRGGLWGGGWPAARSRTLSALSERSSQTGKRMRPCTVGLLM